MNHSTMTREQHVVVYVGSSADARRACKFLQEAGLRADAAPSVDAACRAMESGAGCLVLAEEVLSETVTERLAMQLRWQPEWSDLPIVLLAQGATWLPTTGHGRNIVHRLGNVALVDRPVRIATLIASVRNALRARHRQYSMRAVLLSLSQREAESTANLDFGRRLMGIVSHDLRNPIAAILLASEAILRKGSLDERLIRSMTRIFGAATRAERMIADLLDLTRSRAGQKMPLRFENVDAQEIARSVADEMELSNPGRFVIEASGDTNLRADPGRLGQVVSNLIGNALKYGDPEKAVSVTVTGDEHDVDLAVHNFGTPIPEAQMKLIFEPMERGLAPAEQRSLGLGLYIVKEIATGHHGSVRVSSDATSGTTFHVRLPKREPQEAVQ